MLPEEENPDKLYYSISEVSKMLGVNASLIRFWEKEFDVLRPKKNSKGNRQFTKEDVSNLRLIYHLVKEQGYTLQGANDKIKLDKGNTTKKVEIIDSLYKVRNLLTDIKDILDKEAT